MIMRDTTPRALGLLGAMAVLALASLALPLLPGRAAVAQEPATGKAEGNDDPRAGEIRKMAERLQAMRAQLEKEQRALHEKQLELEKHFRNLHEAMRKLGIAPDGRPNIPGGEQPRDPRRDGGFPGKPPFPSAPQPPMRRDRPDLEQRLGNLEKVLHQVLQEIGQLRRELGTPGQRGPGGGGRPGEDPAGRPGRGPGGDGQRAPRATPANQPSDNTTPRR